MLTPILNGTKFDDPIVFIHSENETGPLKLMVDCGWMGELSPFYFKKLQNLKQLLISHTHLDHFVCFGNIIKVMLDKNEKKSLDVFGPEGIIKQVGAALNAFTWNLADKDAIIIKVHELSDKVMKSAQYLLCGDLKGSKVNTNNLNNNLVFQNKEYSIRYIQMDHLIPSIGYSIQEPDTFNIDKEKLDTSGLAPGPWIKVLKDNIINGTYDLIDVNGEMMDSERLASMCYMKKGIKIVCLTDFRPNGDYDEIVSFANKADILICESRFMEEDLAQAKDHMHMTSKETGILAKDANVGKLIISHFSRRYTDEQEIINETRKYFKETY